jgi:uncharacterized membrane protein YidH (DUF202 family)
VVACRQNPRLPFTLANERTFLAWIRTALALMAGAVGVEQFAPKYLLLNCVSASQCYSW